MSGTLTTPDGPVAQTQGGTIYVKQFFNWQRFVWAGELVTVGDIVEPTGGVALSTRGDARNGGIRRDNLLRQPPTEITAALSMKRVRGDRLKTQLLNCFWLFDKRTQCDSFDDRNRWSEIRRVYFAKVGTRTDTPGTTIAEAAAEEMVNFEITALEAVDIYRINAEAESGIVTGVNIIKCADVAHGERCVGCGDNQTDCVIVAGTEDDVANPHILVNRAGGALDSWTDITVTEWAANDVDGIVALGNWGGAVSNGEAEVLHSINLFTNRVNYTTVDLTANPPNAIAARSQSFVVVVGDSGYIYISRDGLSTIETANAGTVTAQNLTGVMIAPSNAQVVYIWSSVADVILKTENGGETWFQVALTGTAGGIQSLCVHPENENMVLVGTTVGEVYQTTDGGETWTEQSEIPGLTTKATTVIQDIKTQSGGVWFMAVNDPGVAERVYVNYEDGANGAWVYQNPISGKDYTMPEPPIALAVCGPNRVVVVGGDGSAADMVGLIA